MKSADLLGIQGLSRQIARDQKCSVQRALSNHELAGNICAFIFCEKKTDRPGIEPGTLGSEARRTTDYANCPIPVNNDVHYMENVCKWKGVSLPLSFHGGITFKNESKLSV